MSFPRFALIALVLIGSVLPGCRKSTSKVHGNVSYEGAPIGRGQITFMPVGGRGVARSGPIQSGKYEVVNVPPGQKIVEIVGVKQIHFPKTHAEAAEAAKQPRSAAAEMADEVPANAVGNNQTVETERGDQELNFDLKRPRHGAAH